MFVYDTRMEKERTGWTIWRVLRLIMQVVQIIKEFC